MIIDEHFKFKLEFKIKMLFNKIIHKKLKAKKDWKIYYTDKRA